MQPAFESKPSFSPESVKHLVAFIREHLIGLCASALALLVIALVVSVVRLPNELDKTISANRLNDAADLAEKLFVSRFGALNGGDAESYSEAFYKRAQVFAKNGNFKRALVDLSKVLPSFSRSNEVAQLKASYKLSLTQANPPHDTNAAVGIETRSPARPTKSKDFNEQSMSRMPVHSKTTPEGSTSIASDAAINAAEVEAQATDCASNDTDEVNSEEADMAAYNRHLAEYFSHRESNHIKDGKNSADSKDLKVLKVKDPPSFSEWVQTGKADF
ncbi:MAG: hypothetical protein IT342_16245 [Candidatus Melainabacteria bacterium]|nr:hypothetical protein [Candidatus Melainabacteria bacterium]